MEKQKVFHILDSGGIYGIEKVLLNLLPNLKKYDKNVELISMRSKESNGGEIGRRLERKNIEVQYLNIDKKITIKGLSKFILILLNNSSSIIHAHGYKSTIFSILVGRLFFKKIIVTIHSESKYNKDVTKYEILNKFLLKYCHKIIAVSNNIFKEYEYLNDEKKKVCIIENGIIDQYKIIRNINNSKQIKILYAGRLIKTKNVDLILLALRKVLKTEQNFKFIIAGDGPEYSMLVKLTQDLGLHDYVTFLGYVSNIENLYFDADIFVLPSSTEGMPISILEAMASNTAIIASSVGSIPDIIDSGENGLIIRPESINELTKALESLIFNPNLRNNLSFQARDTFLRKYEANIMVKKYIELYKTLALNLY